MATQELSCSRYRFGLPLDEAEAKKDIAARKKSLEIALTTGYDVFIFMLQSRMAAYGTSRPLCIHPKTDGTFEITPPSLGGNNIPQCIVGINFLWSSNNKESFRLEAAASFDYWLLEYAGFVGNRLQPRCPKLWKDVFVAVPLTSIVGNFWKVQGKQEQANRDKVICFICKQFQKQLGVCCTSCHRWVHLSCVDNCNTSDASKEELARKYSCTNCQRT